MTEYVDWSPEGEPAGLVVLLPGRGYTTAMPLLFFARLVALQHGWAVREVSWEVPEVADQAAAGSWVADELRAAIDNHAGPVRVIAKSLGTRCAPYVADQGYDAVWLTPILIDEEVAAAIARHPGRQLAVGGTADELWDRMVVADLPCDVLEVPGADHIMAVPADSVRTAEVHVEVARTLDRFFGGSR